MQKETERLNCDLCVIGGGMAGICAAVSAARLGLTVVLVQDRNVLGGNASSEVRMWIRGAGLRFPNYAEGGLLEEIALDNMYYNPNLNYSVWDGVLYNKVISEKISRCCSERPAWERNMTASVSKISARGNCNLIAGMR